MEHRHVVEHHLVLLGLAEVVGAAHGRVQTLDPEAAAPLARGAAIALNLPALAFVAVRDVALVDHVLL